MPATIDIELWDVIETPSGIAVIVIPPAPRPHALTVEPHGCSILTAGATLRLVDSARCAKALGGALAVIVAEADEGVRRETVVDVNGNNHGRQA